MATLTTGRHPGSLLKELDLGKVTGQLMKNGRAMETVFMPLHASVHNASTDPGRRVHDQFHLTAPMPDDVFGRPPQSCSTRPRIAHTIKTVTRAFGA
jgi:hypothetical protein